MRYGIIALLLLPCFLLSQSDGNWHHLDPVKDSTLGISSYKAYQHLLGRTPDTVVVAVLDNGAAIDHEDLASVIWINTNEIPDNGIDDDANGYIDDVHGWNFLGNAEGKNLKMETTGLTRKYTKYRTLFALADSFFIAAHPEEYREYLKIKQAYEQEVASKRKELNECKEIHKVISQSHQLMVKRTGKEDFTKEDLEALKTRNAKQERARTICLRMLAHNIDKNYYQRQVDNIEKQLRTRLNLDFDNRQQIVGDDPDDLSDTIYGNPMVWSRGPSHGTGVAGVIGALNNELGYTGVAHHVKLMILRIVPNGDERDKDIALAIKYAVDNGASIINCSFGKPYGLHPDFVAEALAYAEAHNVLIVKGSGNSGLNTDSIPYHPLNRKPNGNIADNVLTVGASGPVDNAGLVAFFSNYGPKSVDVLAPGVDVGSCALHNKYRKQSGTSIASPVVAGMAAILLGYYPHLSAKELKEIIIRSVYIPQSTKVNKPAMDGSKDSLPLSEICASGGIVNVYRAILLIESEY